MKLQELVDHIPNMTASGVGVKGSGLLGGSSALAGLAADLSSWTEVSQIAANFGILFGSVVAALSFTYTIYKGYRSDEKTKNADKP